VEKRYSSTLSLTSALYGGGLSTPRPGRFTSGKDPVPTVLEVGWAPGPVWTGAEILTPCGIQAPDCPAHSELLYWLSYPSPSLIGTIANICQQTHKHPVGKKLQVTECKHNSSKNPQSSRHDQNQHVAIKIRINMFKFTVRNVLNHWVLCKERGCNVTYCRALRLGTYPAVPKGDNWTGHTDVLCFPRDDFPVLRLSPV
jgi:hypothetical protein